MESTATAVAKGITFQRVFTVKGQNPLDTVEWVTKNAVIIGADGKEKYRQDGVEVPTWWPDNTVNIVVEKYFRVVNGEKEKSAKQMFTRVASFLAIEGAKQGFFPDDHVVITSPDGKKIHGAELSKGFAAVFYDEILYMLVHGMYAFNSPVWFNMGATGDKKPQCSACFIQSVKDTMSDIMDLAKKEVMLFKGGSGTGSNLSSLRASWEGLSGGGRPSGPVSFMRGYDAFAGITKSGGTTRRAAKMITLNVEHPDILEQRTGEPGFINCKEKAEELAHDLYETGKYTAEWNRAGNVYDLVPYQNANNSVRVKTDFMEAVEKDEEWATTAVKTGKVVKTYKARDIWRAIAKAAWRCGDPGMQFDTTTNEWHTCPASGRINASNPCSEYVFLDDTACNLGSLNLVKFADGQKFKVKEFKHACRLATTAKEIIVDASSYPSEEIEANSHKYRTLGLGFTNLGALLTLWGLPYDSNDGRAVASAISAVMGGAAYEMSAELASIVGPFPEYEKNKDSMLGVIRKHLEAAKRIPSTLRQWGDLFDSAFVVWRDALAAGEKYGYRNAQVTVIAPTGTISFLMGADTTAIEPMLGVVVYKKAVGEGLMVMPNRIVEESLQNLGYDQASTDQILAHITKTGDIHSSPHFMEEKHGDIFAEALGDHALRPEAHVDMMIAVQPFISGAISKTVNMPKESTPEDVEKIYMRAWKGGLKCVAIYRDGCKLSQPISTKLTDKSRHALRLSWGERKKLADTRKSVTHKFSVGGQEGYVIIGFYEDGSVGEMFVHISKAGSTLHGMIDCWAIAVSVGLQYGVPLETLKAKYIDTSFPPSGFTENPEIRIAKSLPDYIFQFLQLLSKPEVEVGVHEGQIHREPASEVKKQLQMHLDGPPCTWCGNMTFRAGSCYCCSACGRTSGCS